LPSDLHGKIWPLMPQTVNNIYLDVDGVILDKNGRQMPYLKEFLTILFVLAGDNIHWLTTHCRDGNNTSVLEYLRYKIDQDLYLTLKRIKPCHWQTLKTEAIDLNSEFLWFDDTIFLSEYRILKRANKEHCLYKVENNLKELVEIFGTQD
jgi:hypothetical protein